MKPSEMIVIASHQWLQAVLATKKLPGMGDAEAELTAQVDALLVHDEAEPAELVGMAHVLITIAEAGDALSPSYLLDKSQALLRRALDVQGAKDDASTMLAAVVAG